MREGYRLLKDEEVVRSEDLHYRNRESKPVSLDAPGSLVGEVRYVGCFLIRKARTDKCPLGYRWADAGEVSTCKYAAGLNLACGATVVKEDSSRFMMPYPDLSQSADITKKEVTTAPKSQKSYSLAAEQKDQYAKLVETMAARMHAAGWKVDWGSAKYDKGELYGPQPDNWVVLRRKKLPHEDNRTDLEKMVAGDMEDVYKKHRQRKQPIEHAEFMQSSTVASVKGIGISTPQIEVGCQEMWGTEFELSNEEIRAWKQKNE